MDEDATGEQILCESTDEFGTYGTYAIKAVQKNTGKVGFSREGYDYSFDYTLPKGEWVTLTFESGKDNVALYVDGVLVDDDPDIYFANHPTTELSATLTAKGITKVCTMLLPLGRIGSTTSSFKGEIDYLTVSTDTSADESYRVISQSELTAEACTAASDGLASAALDGDSSTIWHTNYSGTVDNITDDHNHWFKVTLKNATTIDKITVLPRQTGSNGYILKYNVVVTKADGTEVTVVENGSWASDSSLKTATFDPIEAKAVTLVITDAVGNGTTKFGSMAEFNVYKALTSSDMASILAPFEELNEADYTAESWSAFAQALASAKKLAEDANSSSADLQAAVEKLNTLKDRLAEKETDVSDLFTKIDEAAATDTTGADSKYADALNAAIEAAKAAVANDSLTQEEVTAALAKLESAQTAISLSQAVNKNVDLTGKSQESADVYTAALTEAKNILANENATAAQLSAALVKLNNAETGLVAASASNTGNGSTTPAPGTSETTVPAVGTTKTVGNLIYKVTKSDAKNGTVTVTGMVNKSSKKVVIPSTVTINGTSFKVTAVAAKAFANSKKLANVTIGANVTSIGAKAFNKCAKLSKITFKGTKAVKVGKQAFKGIASKSKVTLSKKMAKKQQKKLKASLKKAGLSKKATYKTK
jgi:hexosaminidase